MFRAFHGIETAIYLVYDLEKSPNQNCDHKSVKKNKGDKQFTNTFQCPGNNDAE